MWVHKKLDILLNDTNGGLSESDRVHIKKELQPFLKEDNIKRVEIISEYGSQAADSVNIERAIDRTALVASYLVSIGMDG